jgi:hypothetical protein
MGFEVVRTPHYPIWVPVDTTATLCVGQLVYYGKPTPANTTGCTLLGVAAGAANITNLQIPWGVVVGTNNATPVTTTLTTALVNVDQITGVNTAAAQKARDWRMAEGMYSKGDPQPLVQVQRITPEVVLKGYFRGSATVGTTMINTLTLTSGAATNSIVCATGAQFTPVAQNHTLYCVTGTNAGLYRVGTGTDPNTLTNTREWPYTPAVGDTFKAVNVRQGICRMNTDTTYTMWIDNAAALTSNSFNINVLHIDLSQDSGNEYCLFQFSLENFIPYNQARVAT